VTVLPQPWTHKDDSVDQPDAPSCDAFAAKNTRETSSAPVVANWPTIAAKSAKRSPSENPGTQESLWHHAEGRVPTNCTIGSPADIRQKQASRSSSPMPGTIGFGRTVLSRGEKAGLNQVIHDMCAEDRDHILERFQKEDSLGYVSIANCIFKGLFRGDHVGGRDRGTTSCMAGSRIKGYIVFSPYSFVVWWEGPSRSLCRSAWTRRSFKTSYCVPQPTSWPETFWRIGNKSSRMNVVSRRSCLAATLAMAKRPNRLQRSLLLVSRRRPKGSTSERIT
jgi:hypothetical protein